MERQGLFIVIEGIDGSGKATQSRLLTQRLEKSGYEVVTLHFPRYEEPSSYFVRQYLKGVYGKVNDVGPYTSSLFYALDRYEAAQEIRAALADGKIVLADRYTGSSMGHLGTKFAHAEERRGFFIWLDNMEFQMLRLPRPDKSFVLRTPPEVSAEHARQVHPEGDIHTNDPEHLQKAAVVFDDLVQLFPKDFSRIDTVRGNKLMEPDQIHELLWNAVEPLLPQKETEPEPEPAPEEAEPEPTTSTTPTTLSVPIGGISQLLAQQLENDPELYYVQQPELRVADDQPYVIPTGLDSLTETKYRAAMDKLFSLYHSLLEDLTADGTPNPDRLLQAVLPVATKTSLTLSAGSHDLLQLIHRLIDSPHMEAHVVANKMLTEARKTIPSFNGMEDIPEKAKSDQPDAFKSAHSIVQDPVRLSHAWPRNELDLLPHMLYETSGLALSEIEKQLTTWPIDRKAEAFLLYMNGRSVGALQHAHYTWEVICNYLTLRQLQQSGVFEHVEPQPLTPRYGYDVPEIIETAGLSDRYERCFDLSATLYSVLQEGGYKDEAQYATLLGHRLRCKLSHSGTQVPLLHKSLQNPALVQNMHEKLAQVHPLLTDTLTKKS